MKLTALLLICGAALCAQSIVVQGEIVNRVNRSPLAGAHIVIRAMAGSATTANVVAVTDAAGRFEASAPPPVTILILSIGRTGFRGLTVAVPNKPGETRQSVRFGLLPEGVISGKVEDEDGFPAEGVRVQALRWWFTKGERKLISEYAVTVNDLGEYRIPSLEPGWYYVRVVPEGRIAKWDAAYAPQYYGGSADPRPGNRVRVDAGQERHGIDFRLARRQGATISGRLLIPDRTPPGTRPLETSLQAEDAVFGDRRLIQPDPRDGSFTVRHVPPGTWLLRASSSWGPLRPGDLIAEQRLQVGDTDIQDVELAPKAAEQHELSGTVIFAEGPKHRMVVGLRRANNEPAVSATTEDDGAFTIKGLLPGHYTLEVQRTVAESLSEQYRGDAAASARLNGEEVLLRGFWFDAATAGPLEIRMGRGNAALDGKLLDGEGKPVAGAPVMLVGQWGQDRKVTDQNGAFHYAHLFPGEFRVIPIGNLGDDPEHEAADPALAADYPPVFLAEGTNAPVIVTVKASNEVQ